MQFALFYPTDAKHPISAAFHQGKENLGEYPAQRMPTFMDKDAAHSLFRLNAGAHILMKVSLPKPTKAQIRLNLRISFVSEMRSHYWGINIDAVIPRTMGAEIDFKKNNYTGSPAAAPDEIFSAQIEALTDGIAALFDPQGGARSQMGHDVQNEERMREITDMVTGVARAARSRDTHLTDIANRAEEDHFNAFNEVADGAPLIIRAGVHARTWQLGIKRGKLSKTAVKHVRLATPEELRSEEMENAGLSRHSALLLGAAAASAVAAHPDLTGFSKKTQGWGNKFSIDPSVPFHESFQNPDDIKQRRRNMDVIWMQTAWPYRNHGFTLNGTDAHYVSALMSRPAPGQKTVSPSFPRGQKMPPILSFNMNPQENRVHLTHDLLDLDKTCDLLTVSERLADLLRQFNLGSNILQPVLFVDARQRHMANRYMLIVNEDHPSIIQPRCPAPLMASLTNRGIKEYEIVVDPTRHGDLDLWTDGSVGNSHFPLFFSAELKKAIQREKLTVRIGLKRCDTA
jgi:hypothetical protein